MNKTIGDTVKYIRKAKNINQKNVCLNNISRSTLVKIEGNKTNPTVQTFEHILKQLGVGYDEFSFVLNNFQLSERQKLLEKFNNINTSIRLKQWLALEQEMKHYLLIEPDPIIQEYLLIVKALITIESEDDYVKAAQFVSPIWERISKNDVWFMDDIQLLTCIFFMFDSQVALTISQRLIKQTEKYQHVANIKRIRTNTLMNISTLLLNQQDYINALNYINLTIQNAKENEYYTLWLFSKGTKGILLCLLNKHSEGLPLIKESIKLLNGLEQTDIADALKKDVKNYINMDIQN
ncbi:helix-turn-helix domain-containing protein [Listeria ivanovii]|uniref:Putative transcriptional regulator n=1 Tax=Listeria ivanovii (strain ATCC BAA-678 / PAM 55) TaxID=881621 RepID=G2Z8W4_LISIP|nr:helix-turn-helix transcriptional regulator [Listeria ivanovii]AHI54706.1 transcriptional regulator [Listeria ivanovii WSLC3009]AIS64174.1 transcriptional regulator [Listeria ivanovii subsp. ivanovii]MBC1760667.1 helix-turn-helix transcriptional regulator [Listeria ivanovii]MBK3915667.1 helix-turn-helix transcriptional regulator [Listeria ivanovii subsp. ivanovii]MBK3922783.1 helix-turn-helix transcriptional regulator [Listeria ivanovii subsp. ivanovii]